MQCPYCGADSQVVDSRASTEGVRRRRVCNACKRRFTTYEKVGSPGLKVIKRDERTEPFDSDKLEHALARVCRRRQSITADALRRIARDIEAQLVDAGAKSVRTSQIAMLALERLRTLDKVAYDRLAANYIEEDGILRTEMRKLAPEDTTQLGLFEGEAEPGA